MHVCTHLKHVHTKDIYTHRVKVEVHRQKLHCFSTDGLGGHTARHVSVQMGWGAILLDMFHQSGWGPFSGWHLIKKSW